VGFGALGKTKWNWPTPSDKRVAVALIPSVGIQSQFKGQPVGPPEERYSSQIMLDLIAEARGIPDMNPLIALFVHPDDLPAIRLYKRIGFQDFHQRTKGEDQQVEYVGMIRSLV